jgi:hypothetical protein
MCYLFYFEREDGAKNSKTEKDDGREEGRVERSEF